MNTIPQKLPPKRFEMYYLEGVTLKSNCGKLRKGYQSDRKVADEDGCCLEEDSSMLLTEKDIRRKELLEDNQLPTKDDKNGKREYHRKGPFSSDLKFLEDILNDDNSTSIHSLCKDLHDYLKDRQKCYRMEKCVAKGTCTRINKSNAIVVDNISNIQEITQIVHNFGLCRLALKTGNTNICIKKGKEILDLIDNVPSDFTEKKQMAVDTIHYLVMAYLLEENFPIALKYCSQQLSAATDGNMLEIKGRALRDFGEVYFRTAKYEKALQFFQESLLFVQYKNKIAAILCKTWYRISDCQMRLKNLEEAEESAKKCLQFVVKYQKRQFQIDTRLLLAEIAVESKKMEVAKEYYKEAFQIAVQNKDARQNNLEQLLKMVEEFTVTKITTKD